MNPLSKLKLRLIPTQNAADKRVKQRSQGKKKSKVIAMEFASIKNQGRTLKMLGEFAPGWRAKTRPRNKLRLSMKKLLNPRLDSKEVTVLDDDSSDEKPKIEKKKQF